MHPYETQYATPEFWAALKERLAPVLGDVEQTLGQHWMDEFEQRFSRSDFLALAVAKQFKAGFDWHVVKLYDPAKAIVDEDWIMAADSREQAVAYVLGQCTEHGVWPNAVTYFADTDHIELTLNGLLFAEIRKLPTQTASSEVQKRVSGTLYGLRKNGNLAAEFTKRLKRWPGLSKIETDFDGSRSLEFHLPDTGEWLISAKQLAAMAGIPALTTQQAQTIAAIVFGEPSWNHLCGYFLEGTSSPASICCAWNLYKGDGAPSDSCTAYQNFDEAFASFLDASKDLVIEHSDKRCAIRTAVTIFRLPCFNLTSTIPHEKRTAEQIINADWDFGSRLGLCPIEHVYTDEIWLARVKTATAGDMETALRELFQISQPSNQKHRFRYAELQLSPIAQEAGWMFSFELENRYNEHPRIEAILTDDHGNTIYSASAPLRAAELRWNNLLSSYILSSEYDGNRPVAIIKGISQATAQKVANHFHESRIRQGNAFLDADYQRDLDHLIQIMPRT